MMTRLTEQAIERLRRVPKDRQDQLASLLLHEIEEDERWARSTEAAQSKLRGLIDDVLESDQAGQCPPLDADQL